MGKSVQQRIFLTVAIIAVLIVINRHVAVSTSQPPLEGLLSYSSTACETDSQFYPQLGGSLLVDRVQTPSLSPYSLSCPAERSSGWS